MQLTRFHHTRYLILGMLFLATTLNQADRATLAIVGTPLERSLGLGTVGLGYVFSAHAWAYVLGQIPGGRLLDRFGASRVYLWSIALWSLFTLAQAGIGWVGASWAAATLFAMRFLMGLAESPAFPANGRLTAAWFPTAERGFASATFTSGDYLASGLFAPLMGWLTHVYSWHMVFVVMGGLGLLLAILWKATVHAPDNHPWVSTREVEYITAHGAVPAMDREKQSVQDDVPLWHRLRQLLSQRMLVGVYLGQFGITTLTYFFLTWFPVYLVQARHMSILKAGFMTALPALCGLAGGLLGGSFSDWLIRRGYSLTFARKLPIVVGMLLSTVMLACNYIDNQSLIIACMGMAFFGKGLGALGWAVVADTSPGEITGLCGGLFNTIGNIAGITTPIIIGYILQATGSFDGALIFVCASAALTVICYLFVVGPIKRLSLADLR